jgi:hypothetical protein
MKLGPEVIKKLSLKYEPSTTIDIVFKGYDMSFKTDDQGNPIMLFMGKRKENGNIKGDRFARTLKYDRNGVVIKDHWERKGTSN